MVLIRDLIKASNDRPTKEITIPEWNNVTVFAKTWSAGERQAFINEVYKPYHEGSIPLGEMYARVLVHSLIDQDGQPVFTEADKAWLAERNAAVLDRVLTEVMRHNAVYPDAVADAKKN